MTGGGFGPLSRLYGQISDHLYAVETVVVDENVAGVGTRSRVTSRSDRRPRSAAPLSPRNAGGPGPQSTVAALADACWAPARSPLNSRPRLNVLTRDTKTIRSGGENLVRPTETAQPLVRGRPRRPRRRSRRHRHRRRRDRRLNAPETVLKMRVTKDGKLIGTHNNGTVKKAGVGIYDITFKTGPTSSKIPLNLDDAPSSPRHASKPRRPRKRSPPTSTSSASAARGSSSSRRGCCRSARTRSRRS